MKNNITWIDPTNTNPHFLELASTIFCNNNIHTKVISNLRKGHSLPDAVDWVPFISRNPIKTTTENSPITKLKLAAQYIAGWTKTLYTLNSHTPSVLFTTNLHSPFVDLLFLRLLKARGTQYNFLVHRTRHGRSPKHSNYVGLLLKEANLTITLSHYIKEELIRNQKIPEEKIITIPHPHYEATLGKVQADLRFENEISTWLNGNQLVTFASSLIESHGAEDLIAAIPFIRKEIPNCNFLLIGNDNNRGQSAYVQSLKKLAQNIQGIWIKPGFYTYSELIAALKHTSLISIPYRSVPQSGVVPLAYTFDVPVVATNTGGLPESIIEGSSGELAIPNSPEDLAGKTLKILRHPNTYKIGCKAAKDTIFSCEEFVKAIRKSTGF